MTGRTECHSGYVNSHHSYLETHSLLSSQRDSKSVHPFLGSFIPTCQQMRSLHTCTKLPSCSCVFWMCLCVLTKKLAALAHSQPASSDKPNESPEKRYLPALSCSVLSSLSSVFFPPPLSSCSSSDIDVCINQCEHLWIVSSLSDTHKNSRNEILHLNVSRNSFHRGINYTTTLY